MGSAMCLSRWTIRSDRKSTAQEQWHTIGPHRIPTVPPRATESYCLPIYARPLGHDFDRLGVSVIECGGKGQIDRLYRIFNELAIPCYVLFDYDKDNPDKEAVQASRDLLEFLDEKPDEPPTAHVSDRFACFAGTWESDLKPTIADYDGLAAKARAELGLRSYAGKPLLARYIARKLTEGDTPVVPPILRKIIQKAVNVAWRGSYLHKVQAGG